MINNRPLYLQSDLICELTHKLNGPIINVNCQETSITQQQWFPLFSINTLTLNVNMQINLTEETEYNGEFIKFDGISETDFEVPDKNHTLLVNNLLIENNITNHNYINMIMNTPDKFSYFIEQLKCLTYEQWKIVYNSWEESIRTREIRYFLENVMLEVQTESSIIFIINHFIVNAKNEYKQLKWINYLSIVKKPSIEFMKEIKSLLTDDLYNHTVYYVSLSIKRFVKIIHHSLKTLQTVANIGKILSSQKIISLFQKILIDYKMEYNDNLRLYFGQIIDHFRCEQNVDNILWNVFLNTTESNELRITIFNSYINCLTDEKMKKIMKILNKSLDIQIRSYMICKLVSLFKTHDPSKKHLQLIVYKYENEIIQLNKDNGFLFIIRNSGYYEWIQKTKYGNFFVELTIIYESYSILPNTIRTKLKYQNKAKLSNIIDVLYQYGSETFLYKFLINLIKTITSTYVPWMKDYTANIYNQTQTLRKYDSIFIKWFDEVIFHSSNISYQIQNWFTTEKTILSQPIKLNHAKHLWKSKNEQPLLSGFYIEWKTNVISYMNSYMNSVYSLNPYQFSLFINHKSKFYTSQTVQLMSGSYEIFGYQSDKQIDWNFHLNNSFKLATVSNLSMEMLFDPWSYNYELFKYIKTDFFMKNGKPYINSQSSILNHSIETTLHPFNWLHLNIERLCNSEDKYLSIQWFQINIIEIKGFLLQFNYLSTSHEETKNNLTNINHFFIHRLNVSMQQNHNLQNNIFQFNIKIKYQNNNLQYVDLNCLVFQKDSYHLQIDITQDGLIQAIGYFNEQRMIKANGSLEVQGNDTNARIQLHNPSIFLNVSFKKYHNSLLVVQAISQADHCPFQFSLINYVINQQHLKMLTINSLQTVLSLNVSNFLKIYWSINLNSTEDNNLPSYYSKMLFNITIFQHFLIYQSSVYWNETSINNTNVNTNENDKNITIKTKAESSASNHFNFECTINMFKTKTFLTPYYGQPTKFHINIKFVSPNKNSLREFSLMTHYEVNIQQLRSIKTSVTSTFADEKIGFILNNQLEWKLTDIGMINRLYSTTNIYSKLMNESIKLILLHNIENQLLSLILMEYNNQYEQKIYSIKSWLQPWRNLHEFILQWPNLKLLQIITIYDIIPIDLYSGITLDHLIYFNHIKYFIIKNQIMFKLDEQKLSILYQIKRLNASNTTELTSMISNITQNEEIILQLEFIIQLYYHIKLLPLYIQMICESKIHFYLSNYKINKNMMGKLKLNIEKLKSDIHFELLNDYLNNQVNNNIQLQMNYDFYNKSIIHLSFKTNTQLNIQNNLMIYWKSINRSQYLIINCMIPSYGKFIYHFKHKWNHIYFFEGSNMLSIQLFIINNWLNGFYLNNNYILQLNTNEKLFEIYIEYNTNNSLGPGTPIRIRIMFKHDEYYKHGNLEISLNSQLIGYYIGYEMMNSMIQYQLDTSNNKKSIDFISHCIIGYRFYEGRGTKGYQIELFIIQYKNNDQLDILLKIGRPGLVNHNIIEYNHLLQRNQTKFQISTVYLNNPYFHLNFDIQYIENLLLPIYSNISLFIPWNHLRLTIQEQLKINKSSSIIYENLLISMNQSTIFYYFNQSFIYENKLIKSLNILQNIYLQWNTNVYSTHYSILSYKSLQNTMNTEYHEQFIGNWNSSIYLTWIHNHFNNNLNIYYNLTDHIWNNRIDGNMTEITKIKLNTTIYQYNYYGNIIISFYHIDIKLINATYISKKQLHNSMIKNYIEFSYCQNQTIHTGYLIESIYKQQSGLISYHFYNKINNNTILNVYLKLEDFDNFQVIINIIPINFTNIQLINIQLTSSISVSNIDWMLNATMEIQPYLPKILMLIKIYPIMLHFNNNNNTLHVHSKPLQYFIIMKNTDKYSEWKLFNMSYIQTFDNDTNMQAKTVSIQLITPLIILPYITVTVNKSIQRITTNETLNNLIEFNHTTNYNQSINIQMNSIQINNNNLTILINIHKKYKLLLDIRKIIKNSLYCHFINISLFNKQKQLNNFVQTFEINQLNKQFNIYQLKQHLQILNNNNDSCYYNLLFNLIHSNEDKNNLFNLFNLHFNSNIPILIKEQINEMNIYFENNNSIIDNQISFKTIFNYSLNCIQLIYYQLQIKLIKSNYLLLFLKYEIYSNNKWMKFKQNQNCFVEFHIYKQSNYSIIFNYNEKYSIINYDVSQSLFILNIEKFIFFKTNIMKFILLLLYNTTNHLNYTKQNIQQITNKTLFINNENNLIDFIVMIPKLIDFILKFQLYNTIEFQQIYQISIINMNVSTNLSFIPSINYIISMKKQNISFKQLITSLDYYGCIKNLLYNGNINQSNLISQANRINNQNKIMIIKKNGKKSIIIRTFLRKLTYSIESNQFIVNETNNIYKNKTIIYESINMTNLNRKNNIRIKFTTYQNYYILYTGEKTDEHMERLQHIGFNLETNILKQGSINILSKISKSTGNTQLIVTMNHGYNSTADHQLIVTWPHVFEEEHYPLLFLKTSNKSLNLTVSYFQQPGLLNTSLQIITNEHHTQCKFYWKKWNSIHLLIENYLEFNYNLIYQNYNNNIYHINYDYHDIFQIIYQLYNQNKSFNFSYIISMNYQDKNIFVNNADLLDIKSVIGSNEHNTILQIKLTKNYGAMLQVISHHQSINQSSLNGRLIVHLDHSNILHLFSYWRPEISEDLSLSMNGLPKQINSIIQFSFSKIYQYGQQFIIMFTNNLMNSIDQIKFNQSINIIYSDLEYTTYLLIYWINNESVFIESINIPIIKNILSMNLNIKKLNFLEKWHGYNKMFNNLIQSKFNLIKYFDNIYKHLMIYIESNTQHNSFEKLIDNINPFLNYLVNKTIEKSEDFSKDSIKGLKISFNAFDAFWYSVVEIYNIWIKMPSKISENIYNLLVNDARNSAKLENITVYLKQVNERLKISYSLFESIRNNVSTIGQCASDGISEQWWNENSNYEQLNQFIQLIKQKEIEESYTILFKPHLRTFTKSMDKNQYYFKIYIPQLIKIFTYYVPKIWPYYLQILEEQSKMKSQVNQLTTESNNFV
ncbi:unnamed protein product [Schistosoma mattheei]|uniref:Vitellogenin domain-containing protein n=1 Tax=Schistosoma mattheei TaxID=31246 RepID=A0AA85AWK4_9TREM|nr:unnamed protein product [Schistosoma mattheei]